MAERVKTCITCHDPKPVSEFYRRGDKAGYRPNCKECYKARNNSIKGRARADAIKEVEAIERNPHGFLAEAIIEVALYDYREKESMRGETLAFFCGKWFEELCDMAGLDPDRYRKLILESE